MSEIRDRVIKELSWVIYGYIGGGASDDPELNQAKQQEAEELLDILLTSKYLAVVDREAELPKVAQEYQPATDWEKGIEYGYDRAQQDMLKAGWIKEVKD